MQSPGCAVYCQHQMFHMLSPVEMYRQLIPYYSSLCSGAPCGPKSLSLARVKRHGTLLVLKTRRLRTGVLPPDPFWQPNPDRMTVDHRQAA